jgi:hypothetical protein
MIKIFGHLIHLYPVCKGKLNAGSENSVCWNEDVPSAEAKGRADTTAQLHGSMARPAIGGKKARKAAIAL